MVGCDYTSTGVSLAYIIPYGACTFTYAPPGIDSLEMNSLGFTGGYNISDPQMKYSSEGRGALFTHQLKAFLPSMNLETLKMTLQLSKQRVIAYFVTTDSLGHAFGLDGDISLSSEIKTEDGNGSTITLQSVSKYPLVQVNKIL